jgi:hypothetical protein
MGLVPICQTHLPCGDHPGHDRRTPLNNWYNSESIPSGTIQRYTMKTELLTTLTLAALSIPMPTVQAGDREWSTAGKVLTGVVAAGVLAEAFRPHYQPAPVVTYVPAQPTVIYQAPVAPPAPVAYAAPAPQVVYVQTPPSQVVVQPPPVTVVYYPTYPVVAYRPMPYYGHHHHPHVRVGVCW